EIDASARAVQLVAEQLIRGTGRETESAMDAAAQNGVRLLPLPRFENRLCQRCLHALKLVESTGIEDARRIERFFQRAVYAFERRRQRMKDRNDLALRAEQRRMPAEIRDAP